MLTKENISKIALHVYLHGKPLANKLSKCCITINALTMFGSETFGESMDNRQCFTLPTFCAIRYVHSYLMLHCLEYTCVCIFAHQIM